MQSMATPTASEASTLRIDGYAPIESYAAIGDGRTLALVATDGAIDWLCLPELDSASVFGALLDAAGGGRFELAPSVPFASERRYVERTNVLETTFRSGDGAVRVTDAFTRPAGERPPGVELVRRIEGLSGAVPLRWRVEPRFDAARFERHGDVYVFVSGETRLAVRAWFAGDPAAGAGAIGGEVEVGEGGSALLTLTAVEGEPLLLSRREDVECRLEHTVDYWRR